MSMTIMAFSLSLSLPISRFRAVRRMADDGEEKTSSRC